MARADVRCEGMSEDDGLDLADEQRTLRQLMRAAMMVRQWPGAPGGPLGEFT